MTCGPVVEQLGYDLVWHGGIYDKQDEPTGMGDRGRKNEGSTGSSLGLVKRRYIQFSRKAEWQAYVEFKSDG